LLLHRQLKTQLEVAKIDRQEAVIRFRQSVLTAMLEISNSLVRPEKLKVEQQEAIGQANH
jgi:outer membrane protein TolC